jgi:cell division protein FtsN
VAEIVKEAEVKLPVESEPKAEPQPSIPAAPATIPEVPVTGGDKSVSEIVPSAPVPLEIPGEAQAPVVEKAPVPNDGGTPAQGGIAKGPKSQSYHYMVHVGSFVDREVAEEIKNRLNGEGYSAVVKTRKHQELGEVFAIQLQPVDSFSRATALMTKISGEIETEASIITVPSRFRERTKSVGHRTPTRSRRRRPPSNADR